MSRNFILVHRYVPAISSLSIKVITSVQFFLLYIDYQVKSNVERSDTWYFLQNSIANL